jgi:hypothetical protein
MRWLNTLNSACAVDPTQNNRICVADAGLGQANQGDQKGGYARGLMRSLDDAP